MSDFYNMDYDQMAEENRRINADIAKGDPKAMYAAAQMAARWQNNTEASYWRRQAALAEKGLWKPQDEMTYDDIVKVWEMDEGMTFSELIDFTRILKQRGEIEDAARLYDLVVAEGNPNIQYRVVQYDAAQFYYEIGRFEKARYWYAKAAEQGHSHACLLLADMYRDGEGGEPDTQTAVALYGWVITLDDYEKDEARERLRALGIAAAPDARPKPLYNWDNSREIAALLNEKFPRTDVLSLTDDALLAMMDKIGLLDDLPEIEDAQEKADALFAIKCALTRAIEGDGDYDARQGDAHV
jgi:tetratricopeptide (TPR) repeat protein